MRAAVVLLAAGNSSRLGSPKQLLAYNGRSLLRHSAEIALASRADLVCVVLGSEAERLATEVSGLPVVIVPNPRWAEGMGTSIQAGLNALPADIDCAILTLCDQPLVTAAILNRLLEAHEATGQPVVTSAYAETVGVPVLFARERFADLLALKPAQGCKGVILAQGPRALQIPCPEAEVDVDTAADYQRLRESALGAS